MLHKKHNKFIKYNKLCKIKPVASFNCKQFHQITVIRLFHLKDGLKKVNLHFTKEPRSKKRCLMNSMFLASLPLLHLFSSPSNPLISALFYLLHFCEGLDPKMETTRKNHTNWFHLEQLKQ